MGHNLWYRNSDCNCFCMCCGRSGWAKCVYFLILHIGPNTEYNFCLSFVWFIHSSWLHITINISYKRFSKFTDTLDKFRSIDHLCPPCLPRPDLIGASSSHVSLSCLHCFLLCGFMFRCWRPCMCFLIPNEWPLCIFILLDTFKLLSIKFLI